jgi:hypothetical protein
MAGFTENDTFRSNQIREGLMSREEALRLTREENMPSIESIRWYTDTLGLDSEEIAACLDEVPKLYHRAHRQ